MQLKRFDENGFGILNNVLNAGAVLHLRNALSKLQNPHSTNRKRESLYGIRNLLNLSTEIRAFSNSIIVRKIAEKFLGEKAQIVRAIFFDKTADANWKVPWHQDLTIAVKEKRSIENFIAWTCKAGIQHVQPPIEILGRMITLRFHLDDADESNGALKIIPKSHKSGRLSTNEIKSWRQANETRLCSVKKGDCLIMRPLILHSSSAGSNPVNRRVIHFEFAAEDLPDGLEWYGS